MKNKLNNNEKKAASKKREEEESGVISKKNERNEIIIGVMANVKIRKIEINEISKRRRWRNVAAKIEIIMERRRSGAEMLACS